jgi:hypothetical protein
MNRKEALLKLNSLEDEVKVLRNVIDSSKTIFDKVKTYEDALVVLNIKNPITFNNTKDEIAYIKLKIIARALNEGWKPKFGNYTGEVKYYCRFRFNGNCTRFHADGVNTNTGHSNVPNSLAFRNKETAEYAGKKFISIWNDYLM